MMSRKWYMKIFRRVCNHSILRIYRNLLRKKMNFVREVQILYHSRRQRRELWRGGQHCFTETIGSLCRSFFFENKCFFYRFFTLSETFLAAFRRNLVSKVVITACFMSIGTYWGKIKNGFFEKSINFISFSETARKISHGGQHSLHRDNRIFMQVIFMNYMFF